MNISKKEVDNNLVKARKLIRKKLGAEKYTKEFLSKLFVVSTTPYISQILLFEAKQMIGDQALNHLLEASKEIVNGSLISGAAAKGLTGTGSYGSSSAGITAKITLGVVTTISAATIGTAMYQNNKEPAEQETQIEQIAPETVEQNEAEKVIPMVIEEQQLSIDTLEDMLGEEAAERLKAYSVSDEISSEELSEYIAAIGLESEETYWRANIEQRDILYILEKQDKILIVIVREVGTEIDGAAFRFTETSEQLPRSYDIEFCYEEWRE